MFVRLGIFAVLIVALVAVCVFGLSIMKGKTQQAAAPPTTEQVLVAARS